MYHVLGPVLISLCLLEKNIDTVLTSAGQSKGTEATIENSGISFAWSWELQEVLFLSSTVLVVMWFLVEIIMKWRGVVALVSSGLLSLVAICTLAVTLHRATTQSTINYTILTLMGMSLQSTIGELYLL